MKILLAEDEISLAKGLTQILKKNNHTVEYVHNGQDALDYIQTGNYDIAILDIMMPKLDGIQVLQEIRKTGNNIPIVMLTAKSDVDSKVTGLDSGANDYLTKPFEIKELLARIRAVTRTQTTQDNNITYGNITLNRATFELSSNSGSFRLANKEYQLMEILMTNPTHIISTDRLMERIWGYDSDTEINVVWVYISYLRKKLTSLHANIEIKAYRNSGYTLEMIS